MDDVENRIDKHSPAVLPDAERVLIRLIAELEEVARKRVPLERFVTDIMKMSEQLPRGTVQEATANLTSYYLPIRTEESYLSLELRIEMAAALVALIEALPAPLQKLFPIRGAQPPQS